MPLGPRPPRALQPAGAEERARLAELVAGGAGEVCQGPAAGAEEEEPRIDQSDLWLVKYDELALKTRGIPLSHLTCCREGAVLFSRLCMAVDINQQYLELGLFPQWDDIARELNMDALKTEWVRVCVRPEQSFTRALLEIYMEDGGSLGEVIAALRRQRQYRVIQEVSDLAEEFLDVYTTYHKANYLSLDQKGPGSGHLYSILSTLFDTFQAAGQEDPLGKFQLYSGGFKQYLAGLAPGPGRVVGSQATDLMVGAAQIHRQDGTSSVRSEDSGYTSPHRYAGGLPSMPEQLEPAGPIAEVRKADRRPEDLKAAEHTVRILLVFAGDGAAAAEEIVTGTLDFRCQDYPSVKVDFFRLNELELWHALLLNPEGCLMKWLDEMDFVMPLLTPQYLQDLHNPNIPAGAPAPTSAMINKYIYTLLRSEYVAKGCQNTKVRPAMPHQFVEQLYRCKPVQVEPLFKMWKESDLDTTRTRLDAIVKVWARKREL